MNKGLFQKMAALTLALISMAGQGYAAKNDSSTTVVREEWDRQEAVKYFESIGEKYKAEIIASIPAPVIGGIFVIVSSIIALSGFRVIRRLDLDERNMFIIGLPTITTMALYLLPQDYVAGLPPLLRVRPA